MLIDPQVSKDKIRGKSPLRDIVSDGTKQFLNLRKRYLTIEIPTLEDVKQFFFTHRAPLSILVTFFLASSILTSFFVSTHASIANFYSASCLGGWEYPNNASGTPTLTSSDTQEMFTNENSAVLANRSGSLFCGGFDGKIPEESHPEKFVLKLSWSIDDGSVTHTSVQATIPEEKTQSNEDTAQENTSDAVQVIEVPENTAEVVPTEISAPAPAVEVAPAPAEPSPLEAFLSPIIAHAQEIFVDTSSSENVETQSTQEEVPSVEAEGEQVVGNTSTEEESIEPIVNTPVNVTTSGTQILEVFYTLDGSTWNTLGTVSYEKWREAQFEVPLDGWSDISKLQVEVRSLSSFDANPVVYIDSLWLEVEYADIPESFDPPTILLKDASTVISGEEGFNSTEAPTFIIDTPNLNADDIKGLVTDGTAEVLEDSRGVLGDPVGSNVDVTTKLLNPIQDVIDSVEETLKEQGEVIDFSSQSPPEDTVSLLFPWRATIAQAADSSSNTSDITAEVFDHNGESTDIPVIVESVVVNGQQRKQVRISKPEREFHPGKYKIKVTIRTPQAIIISEQDFSWGVLAINVNKSVYEVGDRAYIQMGVLNDGGHTICDADLDLKITTPNGSVTNFSTNDTSIIRAPECGPDNVIDVPDYYAHFTISNETGTYTMLLTAHTINGVKTITDTFTVTTHAVFTIDRTAPTRIWPVAEYPVTLRVSATQNWQGTIIEKVPATFEISQPNNSQNYTAVETRGDTKIISWNVSLTPGEEVSLGYIFNAPDISPEFFLLGKAALTSSSGGISFEETRNWQIASDAACNATGSGTWGGGSDTASFTSCTGSAANGSGTGNRPATTDTLTINAGVALTLAGNVQVAGVTIAAQAASNAPLTLSTFTLTNTGTLVCTLPSANTVTSTIAIGSGTLSNTGLITLNAGATSKICSITISTGVITMGNGITFTGATPVFNNSGAATINLNGGTFGSGGTVTINASTALNVGGTSTLSQAKTFGAVNINTGTLTLGVASIVFGSTTAIADGATLSLGNFAFTQTGVMTVGTGTSGTVSVAGAGNTGSYTFSSGITVNAGGTFNLATGTHALVFAGTTGHTHNGATFNTGTGAITFTGTGAFPIGGGSAMTYGGTMTVLAGRTPTNNNTNTVTIGALTVASPTTTTTLSLTTASTTTITGALTFTANATANAQTVTMNGTANLNAGSILFNAPTSTGASTITCATGATGTLTVTGSGTISLTGSTATAGIPSIDFGTVSTACNLTTGTGAMTIAGAAVGVAQVVMGTGTLTANGNITFGTAGNITRSKLTTGAAAIVLSNTAFGANGTLSIASATVSSSGTTTISGSYTLPTLSVTGGTTTMNAVVTITGALAISSGATVQLTGNAFTASSTTSVTGTIRCTAAATCTGLKTFTGAVTVNSGGSFNFKTGTPTVAPTVRFDNNITVSTGATDFNTNTGAITFGGNSTLDGTVAMTFGGAVAINTGVVVTNSNTSTVTFTSTITIATGNTGMTFSTGSTTTSSTLTFTTNSTAGSAQLVTLQGTASYSPSAITMPATTSTGTAKITASGSGATLTVSGTTTMTGSSTASGGLSSIDFDTLNTNFTTNALTMTGGTVSNAQLLIGTGTFTANAVATISGPASGSGLAKISTITGTINLNVGISFGGTVVASAQLITTGAATVRLTGTMTGAGTITLHSTTTFNTTGTAGLSSAVTLPNLNVLAGTTTMNGVAITVTGLTDINNTGSLASGSATGTKTFTGGVIVDSGGSFNLSAFATITSFGSGTLTASTGATAFNSGTGTVAFTATTSLEGAVAMTFGGTATINSGVVITNNNTNTVTFGALTLASAASGTTGMSLTNGTTTTVTGALTFTANAGVGLHEVMTMNGTANLNAGSQVMNAGTNTGNSSVTCAGGSGTYTVTGALGITAGATAGASTVAIDTCTLTANGLVTITGGTVGVASISASTGLIDFNAGVTFATTLAQARITTSGAATVDITGTITGVGILSGIDSTTTINTKGTVTVSAAVTFPKLTVFSGTTTIGAAAIVTNALSVSSGATLQFGGFAFTASGTTDVYGTVQCTASATCTGLKTFTGVVTIQSGGVFDLTAGSPTVVPTLSFNNNITMASGATTFNTNTGTTSIITSTILSGAVAMTLGAVDVKSGSTLTNSSTSTVTMASMTIAAPTSANNVSLATASTTTITGALAFSSNSTANSQTITMNGTANISAATFTVSAPTSTGSSLVTCAGGGTGTLSTSGATTLNGAATTAGQVTLTMNTCNFTSGGLLTLAGGSTGGNISIIETTGDLTAGAGITFTGTAARNVLTLGSGSTFNLTGTMSSGGTPSINAANTLISTGTSAINGAYTFGILSIPSGTLSLGGVAITFAGTTDINGGTLASTSATGTKTFTGAVTVTTGSFDLSAFATITSFAGGIIMDGTTFNTGTGATAFTATQDLDGSQPIIFGGAVTINTSVTVTNNNTSSVDFNSNLLGSASSSIFATGANSTTNFAGTVLATGRLVPSASSNIIAYDGGTQTIKLASTNPYYNLNITAAGTKSLSATTTVSNTINISAGSIDTVSGQNYALTTNDMIIGASGTLLGQGSTITVTGNWSNSGTFTAGTSTVLMNGATTATVSGETTFANLTITHTSAKEVDFETSGTPVFHVTGLFTVTGHSGQLIKLYSDTNTVKWQIHPTGTASVDYVDVRDGGCESGAIAITPTHFTDSGNNDSCWLATSITFSNDDASIGFGTLTDSNVCYANANATGSVGSDVLAHTLSISTTATAGYTLSYYGTTLTTSGGTITPVTNVATGGTIGASQFAISGALTGTGTMAPGYDHTTPLWSFVDSTTTPLASSAGAATADTIGMHYMTNISPVTPAGQYTTSITYVLTGNF